MAGETAIKRPVIAGALNDLLFADDGSVFIDFFTAHGAAWLGHCHPDITQAMAAQLERGWLYGGLDPSQRAEAKAAVERFFPENLRFGGLYSTGMEVCEFALRICRGATGRSGVLGFEGSMHGKSVAAAALGWNNPHGPAIADYHRIPFLRGRGEAATLWDVETRLRSGRIGAVLLELIQGSNGGLSATAAFYQSVARLARDHGALLVCDEILTGFYRTGGRFRFETVGIVPDIVLFGKACGNGFPVSGLMLNSRLEIDKSMLPGSTYAGNPLACTAVTATLGAMARLDLAARAARIGSAVTAALAWLPADVAVLRGAGALWVVELPDTVPAAPLAAAIYRRGVSVGFVGRQLRLLPAATITDGHLAQACAVVSDVLEDHAKQR